MTSTRFTIACAFVDAQGQPHETICLLNRNGEAIAIFNFVAEQIVRSDISDNLDATKITERAKYFRRLRISP